MGGFIFSQVVESQPGQSRGRMSKKRANYAIKPLEQGLQLNCTKTNAALMQGGKQGESTQDVIEVTKHKQMCADGSLPWGKGRSTQQHSIRKVFMPSKKQAPLKPLPGNNNVSLKTRSDSTETFRKVAIVPKRTNRKVATCKTPSSQDHVRNCTFAVLLCRARWSYSRKTS